MFSFSLFVSCVCVPWGPDHLPCSRVYRGDQTIGLVPRAHFLTLPPHRPTLTLPPHRPTLTTACWEREYPNRPSFTRIIEILKEVEGSAFFSTTSDEVFRSIQSSWKEEIQQVFTELKKKEAVSH